MKSLAFLLLCLCSSFLIACGGGSGSGDSGNGPQDPSDKDPTGFALDIDTNEILGKEYYLKAPLGFADVQFTDRIQGEGTNLERKQRIFSKTFQNQKLMDKAQVQSADSFCTLQVETSVNTRPSDVNFEKGYLTKGSLSESVSQKTRNNKQVKEANFSLYFQKGVFQGFFLNCKNTLNSAQINTHIGHLLEISDKPPIPTTPVVKTIKPKSISVQYVSDPTDQAFPTINHVISIAKKDLPKEKRFSLDLNVYMAIPGGKKQKLAGPIRLHNPVDMVAGSLMLTFAFGKNDSFSSQVINRLRLVQYEFVTAENRGFRIEMNQVCSDNKGSFLDLSKSGMGCPTHIPSTLMTKTMLVAAMSCNDDKFSPTNIGKVSKRQKNSQSRPNGQCRQLIWDLLEDGLTESQVAAVHFFTRNAKKSKNSCEKMRSHIGYRYIKDVERQDSLLFGRDNVTPVTDEDLYELCLGMNS